MYISFKGKICNGTNIDQKVISFKVKGIMRSDKVKCRSSYPSSVHTVENQIMLQLIEKLKETKVAKIISLKELQI